MNKKVICPECGEEVEQPKSKTGKIIGRRMRHIRCGYLRACERAKEFHKKNNHTQNKYIPSAIMNPKVINAVFRTHE